jgi:hypothetical protein
MKSISSDNRGAVMVMAVFVAILLVGLLYHVAGVGGAAIERQLMQDGADAAAFSAATVNARGMNILAMLNLIMVALLTILIALKMVQAILVVLLVVVSTMCAIPPFAGCGLIPPLEIAQVEVKEAADAYQEVAKALIKGLTEAAEAINTAVPLIALAEGYNISTSSPYSRVSAGGVVWPIFDGLPTMKGSYSELCARAGRNITVPIELILPPGIGDFVGDTLGELISQLTESFSSYFCGDDGEGNPGEMPETSLQTEDVSYPPGQYTGDQSAMWNCSGTHPQESDGKCLGGDCKNCAEMGCNYCLGRMKSDGDYKSGLWTIVKNDWVEWLDGDSLVRILARGTTPDRWSLKTLHGNPCNSNNNPDPNDYYTNGCVAYQSSWSWNPSSSSPAAVPSIEKYSPRPICEIQDTEEVTSESDIAWYFAQYQGWVPPPGEVPEITLVNQTLFVALSSCLIEEEIEIEAEGEPMVSSEDEEGSMAPRVLDPERFPEEAEVTSILYGTSQAEQRKEGVAIGFGGSASSGGTDKRFAFAAAEYYSMDSDDEAMWHMRWLCRLVRFQLGSDDDDNNGEGQTGQGDIDANNQEGFDLMSEALESITSNLGSGTDIDDYLLH